MDEEFSILQLLGAIEAISKKIDEDEDGTLSKINEKLETYSQENKEHISKIVEIEYELDERKRMYIKFGNPLDKAAALNLYEKKLDMERSYNNELKKDIYKKLGSIFSGVGIDD